MAFPGKRICVVGAGEWGEQHIRTLHAMGCLHGIVEIREERLAQMTAFCGGVRGYAGIRETFKEAFDGYILATPAGTHFELAAELLREGKNVLVEKPFARSSAHSQQLVELAQSRGCRLMAGYQSLFHPAVMRLREMIAEGTIGRVLYAHATRLGFGIVRGDEGVLWSFASHDITVLNFLLGGTPQDIVADGDCCLKPGLEDMAGFTLGYREGIKAHVFVSWLYPYRQHRLAVVGEEGMLVLDDAGAEAMVYHYQKTMRWEEERVVVRDEGMRSFRFAQESSLRAELEYFVGHLDKEIGVCGGRCAHETVCLLEKISERMVCRKTEVARAGGAAYFVHESAAVEREVAIGTGTKIWHHANVRGGVRIGSECVVGQNAYIAENVRIGNGVELLNNVSVYEGVELEDNVFCGPSVVFANTKAPRCGYPAIGGECEKTLVREGASIGANATVICGNTVGRHAFVAAGAVVAAHVLDYELVMGVPARHAGWICACGNRLSGSLICGRCGRCYQEAHEGLKEY